MFFTFLPGSLDISLYKDNMSIVHICAEGLKTSKIQAEVPTY